MHFLVVFLLFGTIVLAEDVGQGFEANTAYGYMKNIGIPLGEKIKKMEKMQQAEQSAGRIVGGVPAALGQYPFQAGILGDIVGHPGNSICGGALVSSSRVITAAHCWWDGVYQAWRLTVVLGSLTVFSGGTRVQTSAVAVHPSWSPLLIRNDIAVVYFATPVSLSANIAPVALPSGFEIFESFAGQNAIATGFGVTSDNDQNFTSQILRHVSLNIIANSDCSLVYPLILQESNVCTSGLGGIGFCDGDSGGPLVINRDGKQIFIGVASFRSGLGCESSLPNAYARITSFLDFINIHV